MNLPPDFDPNGLAAANGKLYGLPFTPENAQLVILPVPWEVTVSYGAGTADGPAAILDASVQVDLYDAHAADAWKSGIAMLAIDEGLVELGKKKRTIALAAIKAQEEDQPQSEFQGQLDEVNLACAQMVAQVKETAEFWLDKGKTVAVLGGDHSTPLGLLQALAARYPSFGILQIDAHCDLRDAFEGFQYSHASIMTNALKLSAVTQLVQVGIRDYCEMENEVAKNDPRITLHTFREIEQARYSGQNWQEIVDGIVDTLPELLYVSFDIDGLDPSLCPHTGTPVPGGLQFEQALFLVERALAKGRKLIGFDLCEVAPGADEWDANVGARVLYRLSMLALMKSF